MDFMNDHYMEEAEKVERHARLAEEEAARQERKAGHIVQYSENINTKKNDL